MSGKGKGGSDLLDEEDASFSYVPVSGASKAKGASKASTSHDDNTLTASLSSSNPFDVVDEDEDSSACSDNTKEKFLIAHTYFIQPVLNHGPAFCLSMFSVNYFANSDNANFINAMPQVVRAAFVMALPPLTSHVIAPLNSKAAGWSFRQDWFGVKDEFPKREILINAAFTSVTFGIGLFAYGVSGSWWEGITNSPIGQTMAQGAVGVVVMLGSKRFGGAVKDSYQELQDHHKDMKNQMAMPSEKGLFSKMGNGLYAFGQHLIFPGQRAEEARKKKGLGN